MTLPNGYLLWESWKKAGGHLKDWPAELRTKTGKRRVIPKPWFALYKQRNAKPPARYGSRAAAGPFAGVGVMLGWNPDVWNQALELAHGGVLDCAAVAPGTSLDFTGDLADAGCKVVVWQPPEAAGENDPAELVRKYNAAGYIGQAESQTQWDQAISDVAKVEVPTAIVLNYWGYGRFPKGCVALVEVYANELGQGVDFGVFAYYMQQGAAAVVIVPGMYSAGIPDDQAAATYASLPADLPGVMGYAGESMITPESLAVLHQLAKRP